jgi:Tfp pilus assembly protein PilN
VRAVNLIPPEERRGDKAPTRTGPLAYVIVAVLAAALLAVTAVVLAGNQITDRKAEKASLETQVAEARAQAARLSAFASFASVQETREQTVASLAQSRFDWERVLRSLALVTPDGVWLTSMEATVSSSVQAPDSGGTSSSASTGSSGTAPVEGPSLHIQGCASGQKAVARFLSALREIDGVTRVSVLKSDRPDVSSAGGEAAASTGGEGSGADCSSRRFISQFEVAAAFDAAQLGATDPSASTTPSAATTTAQPSAAGDAASAADSSQVSDGEQQLSQQRRSAAHKTDKAHKTVDTFVPGTGSAP